MRKLLLLLLLAGCNDTNLNVQKKDQSVRFTNIYQPTLPICENHSDEFLTENTFTCIWECKNFWTNLRGAGRYNVARTWRWHEVNQQWQPTTIGTDAQWSEACDELPVTNCPNC